MASAFTDQLLQCNICHTQSALDCLSLTSLLIHHLIGWFENLPEILSHPLLLCSLVFCTTHKNEPIKFFCKPCDLEICLFCVLGDHENHMISSFEDVYVVKKDNLTACTNHIENQISFLNAHIFDLVDSKIYRKSCHTLFCYVRWCPTCWTQKLGFSPTIWIMWYLDMLL
jgi:hypothetical protein